MQNLTSFRGTTVNVFFLVAKYDDMHSRNGTLEEVRGDCFELRVGGNLLVIPFSAIAYVQIVE